MNVRVLIYAAARGQVERVRRARDKRRVRSLSPGYECGVRTWVVLLPWHRVVGAVGMAWG